MVKQDDRRLISSFVVDCVAHDGRPARGLVSGSGTYAVLSLDISGFTAMTAALLRHGTAGAEQLSEIINRVFAPITEPEQGEVTGFAGDSMTVLFPSVEAALSAAAKMRSVIDREHLQRTAYGDFAVEGRIGISYGPVEWMACVPEDGESGGGFYFFRGDGLATAALAQQGAAPGSIELAPSARERRDSGAQHDVGGEIPRVDIDLYKTVAPLFLPDAGRQLPREAGGEFRETITIFIQFADPGSCAAIAERMQPVSERARSYRGYVSNIEVAEKGVMALVLFGAPVSHGKDLERALAFVREVRELFATAASADSPNAPDAAGSTAGIGLSSDVVFAGYIGGGRATYSVLGDSVNLAARLAVDSARGEVCTAGESADRIGRATLPVSLVALGTRSFRGFSAPLEVYRCEFGGTSQRNDVQNLIGREAEFEQLRDRLNSMRSSAGFLLVLGEAGIGKSAFLHAGVHAYGQGFEIVDIRADTIRAKAGNLGELARAVLELGQSDGADGGQEPGPARAAMAAVLQSAGRLQDSELYSEDDLAGLDSEATFELTLTGLVSLIGECAQSAPVLICIDDAHALDSETRVVLERVLIEHRAASVGVLLSARTEALRDEVLPAVPDGVANDRLELGALAPGAVRALLVRELQGPAGPALVEFVTERVGGNPFYLTELCAYMLRAGFLKRGDDGYEPRVGEVDLPYGIGTLLNARLDALPTELKDTAKVAALIGARFDSWLLLQTMGIEASVLSGALQLGVHNGLWTALDSEGREYQFEIELLREALVQSQLQSTRRQLHAAVFSAGRRLYRGAGDHYSELAYHAEAAGRGGVARGYYWRAARYYRNLFRNDSALQLFDRFCELGPHDAGRLAALHQMAELHGLSGNWEKQIDTSLLALGLAVSMGRDTAAARLMSMLGAVYQRIGRAEAAVAVLKRTGALAVKAGATEVAAEALVNLGRAYWSAGNHRSAQASLEQALEHARSAGDASNEGLALYFQGVVLRDRSRYSEAMQLYEQSHTVFRTAQLERLVTYPLYDMGVVAQYQGRLAESERRFSEVLAVYRHIGYRSGIAAALLNLGVIADRRGQYQEAVARYRESRTIAQAIDERLAIGYAVFSIGAVYFRMQDFRKAERYLRDALREFRSIGAKGYYGYCLSYLVCLYAELGDVSRALRYGASAVTVATAVGSDAENGRMYLGIGRALEQALGAGDAPLGAGAASLGADVAPLGAGDAKVLQRIGQLSNVTSLSAEAFYIRAMQTARRAHYVDTLIPAIEALGRFYTTHGAAEQSEHGNRLLELATRLARHAERG